MKKPCCLLILASLLISMRVNASVVCKIGSKDTFIEIKDDSITWSEEAQTKKIGQRSIASNSISIPTMRTKHSNNGVDRISFFENKKHTFHIEDSQSFNSANDYLAIKNQQGHEIVYPLDCSKSE